MASKQATFGQAPCWFLVGLIFFVVLTSMDFRSMAVPTKTPMDLKSIPTLDLEKIARSKNKWVTPIEKKRTSQIIWGAQHMGAAAKL